MAVQIQTQFHAAGMKARRPIEFAPRKKIVPLNAVADAAKIAEQRLPAVPHVAPRASLGERRGATAQIFTGRIGVHGRGRRWADDDWYVKPSMAQIYTSRRGLSARLMTGAETAGNFFKGACKMCGGQTILPPAKLIKQVFLARRFSIRKRGGKVDNYEAKFFSIPQGGVVRRECGVGSRGHGLFFLARRNGPKHGDLGGFDGEKLQAHSTRCPRQQPWLPDSGHHSHCQPALRGRQTKLYASVSEPLKGRAVALSNEMEDRSVLYLILFSVPKLTVTADVIEFTDQPETK